MKKSVVLLISLLFISSLSILVFESLKDTNKFLSQNHDKFNKIQSVSFMKNIQTEISKKMSENQNYVNDIINEGFLDNAMLNINDTNISFSLSTYDKVNLNDLNNKDKNIVKSTSDILYSYEIYNTDFIKSYLKKNLIQNTKQLENLIENYAKQNDDEKVYEVKTLLGFLDNKNLYELKVKLNDNLGSKMSSYYVLDNKGEVKYFEYSIN